MDKLPSRIGQLEINFLLESAQTNGMISMFEFTVPSNAKVPIPHYHEDFDETIYGLEGTMTFKLNGETINITAGQSVFIPRGATNEFHNHWEAIAKSLAITSQALFGPAYFYDLAEVINAGGPPNREKMKAVMLQYGLIPVAN